MQQTNEYFGCYQLVSGSFRFSDSDLESNLIIFLEGKIIITVK